MAIYKLGELVELFCGSSDLTKNYIDKNKGIYPVISSKTSENGIYGYLNSFMFQKGITISKDGAYAGTIFYQKKPFSITSHAFYLKIKNKLILEKYLFFNLKQNENLVKKIGEGASTRNGISKSNLSNLKLKIPPLETQKSIIDIIDPLNKLIDKLKVLFNKIKKFLKLLYKQSKNEEIFLSKIVILNNKKYNNQKKYVPTSIVHELFLEEESLLKINDVNSKPSRANLTTLENSIIFSKLFGENKIFLTKNEKDKVFSTGFFNLQEKNQKNDDLIAYFLSEDFINSKKKLKTGTTMEGINLNSFKMLKMKKMFLNSNFFYEMFYFINILLNKIKNLSFVLIKILIN
ncbi:restriction endonuclease subunit S [[Mycoplasma] collis]|uniref:restriction endonuclease subunit S n=1 Tax=[Mycoplasma] collis TaxID=2127 RepID=UPI00051B30F5|nr:restriction endonuclease subunit S [[Mycoplasma] collis]